LFGFYYCLTRPEENYGTYLDFTTGGRITIYRNGAFMKRDYDSEVLYEMYKKKSDLLDEAVAIIKDNNDAGESSRRGRLFLEKMGVSTYPEEKEVKFPIPRDDVKPPKKATITEAEFDEYVGFIHNWYPSQQKELGKLKKRLFG
jgi:hypothetical protein